MNRRVKRSSPLTHHRRVTFAHRSKQVNMAIDQEQAQPTSKVADDESRFEELSDSELDSHADEMLKHVNGRFSSPDIHLPPWLQTSYMDNRPMDLSSKTSDSQRETENECLPFLLLDDTQSQSLNSFGLPHLNRENHIKFLHKIFDKMPAPYQVMDAARPWLFYWVLQGLTILGEDVLYYRDRLMSTLRPLQNKTGGFAGGYGQNSHCATTYGCILALAMVDGLEMVDREAMWRFLGQVKQADGGFRVAVMAEEDIRGAYCAMTIITLLNLPIELPSNAPAREAGLEKFTDGLGEWIGRCQTYEGGIAGAPTNEAHGAYAFCALACLSILDNPARSLPKYLDVYALLKWMTDIQTSPEGGFAGRTNKLVDSCYSHWVGGCWALLQPALQIPSTTKLWNREALTRYLLTCCQQVGKKGGMRDKPSARPDAYHTCYSLAGYSAAMNHYTFDGKDLVPQAGHSQASFGWTGTGPSREEMMKLKIDQADRVNPVHPVFVIPFAAVERARKRFDGKSL